MNGGSHRKISERLESLSVPCRPFQLSDNPMTSVVNQEQTCVSAVPELNDSKDWDHAELSLGSFRTFVWHTMQAHPEMWQQTHSGHSQQIWGCTGPFASRRRGAHHVRQPTASLAASIKYFWSSSTASSKPVLGAEKYTHCISRDYIKVNGANMGCGLGRHEQRAE